jgi:uncharacterized membrane protein
MRKLSTTIAVYPDLATAQADWAGVEAAAEADSIDLADAVLVEKGTDGTFQATHRHSHHGWGKGAVAGAVVGLLFPPAIVGGAVAGGVGGGVVARLNRSLDRGDLKDLGDAMDSGEIAIVAVTVDQSVQTLTVLLGGASNTLTRASSTAEEVQEALDADIRS